MTTIAAIREPTLNAFLGRTDGGTKPWTDTDCNTVIGQALEELWPMMGVYFNDVATVDEETQFYTLPAGMEIVSRIQLESISPAEVLSGVPNWRRTGDSELLIQPRIPNDSNLQLRIYGWKPYQSDASDIPDRLATLVAMKAASLAYGLLGAQLSNYEQQIALDSGKQITYADAVGLSSYWQRRYEDRIRAEPGQVTLAPRMAVR